MTFDIYELGLLLAVMSVVALVCERLRLQYTIGLVLGGLALALLQLRIELSLSKDFLYTFLLPPLVFEAALRLNWPGLRRDLPVILALAGPGLAASALLLAAGMHWLAGWSWIAAGLFAAAISATDPVAVVAAFDEAKARGRVDLLVRAESLVNDGSAATAFAILLGIAVGASATPTDVAWRLLLTIGGGLACGVTVAGVLLFLVGRTNNHLVEITLTTCALWFLLAGGANRRLGRARLARGGPAWRREDGVECSAAPGEEAS